MIKVVVIGAGPAGLSAALWLHNLGLQPIVIEKAAATGGMQNFNILSNDWVLGQQASTGIDVAKTFQRHIEEHNISLRLNTEVTTVEQLASGVDVYLNGIDYVHADALLIATGTRYIGCEIFTDITGYGNTSTDYFVEGPYAFFDLDKLGGSPGHQSVPMHIAIMGAGDNAFENALMLLERGCQVSIISRTMPKAQKKFIDAVAGHPLLVVYQQAVITQFEQAHDRLHIDLRSEGGIHQLVVERLHVLAGYQPNNIQVLSQERLRQPLVYDAKGFLVTDGAGRTNISGVYAAGDNSNPHFPCVVSAIASGALAAKTMSRDLS